MEHNTNKEVRKCKCGLELFVNETHCGACSYDGSEPTPSPESKLGAPIFSPCEGGECTTLKQELDGAARSRCEKHTRIPSPDGESWIEGFDILFPDADGYEVNYDKKAILSFITSLIKEKEEVIEEEILDIIKENGHQQENGTIWCDMDVLIKKIAARSTSERVQ